MKRSIDSEYFVSIYATFIEIARQCPAKTINEMTPFIDATVELVKIMKSGGQVDALLDLAIEMSEVILMKSYAKSLVLPEFLPIVSAVLSFLLFATSNVSSAKSKETGICLLEAVFGTQAATQTLVAIFPGIFNHLIKIISNSASSTRIAALSALNSISAVALSNQNEPTLPVPDSLKTMFPTDKGVWIKTTREKVEEKFLAVMPNLLSSSQKSTKVVRAALKAMAGHVGVLESASFRREFILAAGYVIESGDNVLDQENVRLIVDGAGIEESELLLLIHQIFNDGIKKLLRDRTQLVGFCGVVKLAGGEKLAPFVEVEDLISAVSRKLQPDFSKIVPGVAETGHLSKLAQSTNLEMSRLVDFFAHLTEWSSLAGLIEIITANSSLASQVATAIETEAELNLPGALVLTAWSVKPADSSLDITMTKWSEAIDEMTGCSRREKIGNQLLYLHALKHLLSSDPSSSEQAGFLFELLVRAASPEFQVSDIALQMLNDAVSADEHLFDVFLNSIMSRVLRRLRQIELYPHAGAIMSVLVEKVKMTEATTFVMVKAFEEVVKLIDISSGTNIPHYVSTLLALESMLPETPKLAGLVDTLIDRCTVSLSPTLPVPVTVSLLAIIKSFIPQTTRENRFILVAKLFPLLMRRLHSRDLRIAKHIPPTLLACHQCCDEFLTGRVYGDFLPNLIKLIKPGPFPEYSQEYKFTKEALGFLVAFLPGAEITPRRLDLWRQIRDMLANTPPKNAEFRDTIAECVKTLNAKEWPQED